MTNQSESFKWQSSLFGIFYFTTGWAAAGGRTIVLESTAKHPDANGTAFFDGDHVSVQARNLKPNSVYTVWFVNMKPQKDETGPISGEVEITMRRWLKSPSESGRWSWWCSIPRVIPQI